MTTNTPTPLDELGELSGQAALIRLTWRPAVLALVIVLAGGALVGVTWPELRAALGCGSAFLLAAFGLYCLFLFVA